MNELPMQSRTNARLAAVQALYQMEATGIGVESVVREFIEHRLGTEIDGVLLGDADARFFDDVVRGVVNSQAKIDAAIDARLAKNWKLSRLDATVRSILRAGAYELVNRADIPGRAIIDEYLEIANAFFESDEPKFINGVLDGVYREVRDDETVQG